MAENRTDLSRSIATVGKPDSPQGAFKKAGLLGANPAAVEPMFNGSAIMDMLGYNNQSGKIDIGVAGGDPGNRPPAIAGDDPVLAAVKAKDAAITAAPTRITPNAGITQAMVQKPVQAIAGPAAAPAPSAAPSKSSFVAAGNASLVSTPQAIAGMTPDNLQTVGRMMDTGMSANGVRRMDAINQQAIAGIGQPGNGLMDNRGRSYDEQVAHAARVNEANALPTLSPKQAAELAIANDPKRSAVTRANAAQGVAQFNNQLDNSKTLLGNQQAQTIANIKEQGDKYTADQHLTGVKYNADAHTKAAEIAGVAAVQKAQQLAQAKQQEQGQKDYTERIKSLVGDWSKLNLPKEYVPKLNEFAKIYAAAEDPTSNTWLMPPNREGGMYAAMPRQYESVYTKLIQTMPHKDAAARIYQLAQQNGHVKDVPDFRRFLPTSDAIKNQNQTLIAGA